MAEISDPPKSPPVEVIEGEHVETDDYFFCKVGDSIRLTSDDVVFDSNSIPSKPLALSQRFGLIFAAHSSGFCVTKTKDVFNAAKEIKAKRSDSTVHELSIVDVDIGRVSILALTDDSSYISAVVGSEIHIFSINSLLNKDKKPMFVCSVEANYVKDMLWIKETEDSFIVLTDKGKMYLGAISKPLTIVMDEIDAVEKSVDGKCFAVGRKNNLIILSAQLKEILQIELPMDSSFGSNSATNSVKVDSIRWVRSDSIAVGYLKEENYFLQVIMSEDGKSISGTSTVTALQFNDPFPAIVDDIVPYGCGQHLFMNYLDKCEFAFVSNRKNVDQHIMLFSWSKGDKRVSVVDIERDNWLPRIELQENGDDNLVLGLCVDDTTFYENVEVKVGVEEWRELPPHCLLLCLTLEGKLVMFNVASISGCQHSSQTLSALTDNTQKIPLVAHSNLGVDSDPEKAIPKELDAVLDSHELNTKTIRSVPDIPVAKALTTNDSNTLFRKDPVAENHKLGALDLSTSKPFGTSGHSLNHSHAHIGEIEKLKVALPDKSLEKKCADPNKGATVKTGSGVSHNNSTLPGLNTNLGFSGISDATSLVFPLASTSTKSNLSGMLGNSTVSTNIAGNFGSFPSDSSIGKAVNPNEKTTSNSGASETAHSIPTLRLQPRESVVSHNSTSHSLPLMKGNRQSYSPFGPLNSDQSVSEQFGNVQRLTKELDKLLECMEERGNFRDICTIDQRSSLEVLEEGMQSLYERSRVCQNISQERLRESDILLDKTAEVVSRELHMEKTIKQSTDGQYLDMWDRQKLSSEFFQKQQSISNLHQDLVNRAIELEKHFNALELNRFGDSTGTSLVSPARHRRSATSRPGQSLNAIHNAVVSQLAAAEQLSDKISKQMDVLRVESPPAKQASIKKQVFETIGIPCPDDILTSPTLGKMFESPLNKYSMSGSALTHKEYKRSQLGGQSCEFETSRRRRDSLDKNWAKFEVPKTTVKRTLVKNERQNGSGLFSSMDKRSVSPFNLEGTMAVHSKNLSFHDMNGSEDNHEKMNSDTAAPSAFKWAGGNPETLKVQAEQYSRSSLVQGNSNSTVQNVNASASTSLRSPGMKLGNIHVTAERSASHVGYIGKPDTSLVDPKPLRTRWSLQNPTSQNIQSAPPSSPIMYNHKPVPSDKETELTKPDGRSSSTEKMSNKHEVQFSSTSRPFGTPSSSSSSLPSLGMTHSPVASVGGGSQNTPSDFKASSSPAIPLNLISSIGPPREDSSSRGSSVSSVDKVGAETNLATSSVSSQKMAPSVDDKLKAVTPSTSTEFPKSFGSSAGLSKTPTVASNVASSAPMENQFATSSPPSMAFSDSGNPATVASNATSNAPPEKQSTPLNMPPISLSDSLSTSGEKNDSRTAITEEDEMEEEAPESNQTAKFSLGSFAGFGLGSTTNATTTKPNPFSVSLSNTPQSMPSSSPFTVPQGQLFRPASFSFQSPVSQQSQSPNMGPTPSPFGSAASPQQPPAPSGFGQPGQVGFGGGSVQQPPAPSGFGQPGQVGFGGQQALGSVLGSFGQSRQIGVGFPGSGFGSATSSGGFSKTAGGGGFAGTSPPIGGFAGISSTSGGFAGMGATASGFAAAAAPGAGFAAAVPSGGGFAAAANTGGFSGGGGGGFGAFSNPGTGGFSVQGGGAAGGKQPPSALFTQMRR